MFLKSEASTPKSLKGIRAGVLCVSCVVCWFLQGQARNAPKKQSFCPLSTGEQSAAFVEHQASGCKACCRFPTGCVAKKGIPPLRRTTRKNSDNDVAATFYLLGTRPAFCCRQGEREKRRRRLGGTLEPALLCGVCRFMQGYMFSPLHRHRRQRLLAIICTLPQRATQQSPAHRQSRLGSSSWLLLPPAAAAVPSGVAEKTNSSAVVYASFSCRSRRKSMPTKRQECP